MTDRRDHFSRMRHEETPASLPDPSAPVVTQDLVDHLRQRMRAGPRLSVPRTLDEAVSQVTLIGELAGANDVIDYIQTLVTVNR